MTFLGLDLGTSGLRALLTDANGTPIAATERACSVSHPYPGWSEQNPAEWLAALDDAMAELRERWPAFASVRGIGVSGHMHGATLLDAAGNVIRPCILWNDTRAHVEAARLDAMDGVRALSGNIVFPGFTAPKLLWLQTHEAENFQRIARILLPAAYLNHYLTGDYVADCSDSAGTTWLDVGQRDWSETLLLAGQVSRTQMPRLVEGCEPAGRLRAELASRWGLGEVVVAGGAGDNAAAACGMGVLDEGQGFVSLGTSGVILAARSGYRPAAETAVHTFCHAVPDRWYQMGVMLSATDSLNWLGRITGETPAALTDALGDTLKAPGRARFAPYLAGERTPHNDAQVRGGFVGLSASCSREDLTQAVLEGVAFGLRDSLEALRQTGVNLPELFAIGGGARSRYWLKLLATVLNTPLCLPEQGETGAALGAARLARVATTGESPESVMVAPQTHERIEPDVELLQAFETAWQQSRALYGAMRQLS